MNANAIFKALSNEHRLQILLWLKTPEQHFAAERLSTAEETGVAGGVCVPENGRIASTSLKPWRNFRLIYTATSCREPFF